MRNLAAFVVYALGFGFALGALIVLDVFFNHAWLPVGLGTAYCVLLAWSAWRPNPKFLFAHCVTFLSATVALWMYSSVGRKLLINPVLKLAVTTLAGIAMISLVVSVVGYFLLDRKDRKSAAWCMVLLLAGCIIAYLSSSAGGPGAMDMFFRRHFGMTPGQAELAVHYVRKTIHFTFYGSVGFAASRAALAGAATRRTSVIFGLLFVFSLATFDELRQVYSNNRTGSAWDVGLDLAGASCFLLIPPRKKLALDILNTSSALEG
ncbi:hypothetical protein BH11ARM1_BH11ARM1_06260 [soil metagenome]